MSSSDKSADATVPREHEAIARPADMKPIEQRARPIASLVDGALAKMLARASGVERPIPTPWKAVNDKMRGGLWPAFYTLTSGTGSGKTQWAIQCALEAAQAFGEGGDRVRYIALELGDEELVARVLGEIVREPWSDLLYGCDLAGNPDGGAQIAAAVARAGERLRTLPLDIETADAIGWTYHELLRIAAEERPPRMVVLDYTQLVCAPEKVQEDARRTIATVAKVARTLARRGVVVLALSSTARANYDATSGTEGEKKRTPPGQGDPARFVALGKESGELEYTADVVMALAREPETDEQAARRLTGEARRVWLAIAKGRGFPAGWAPLSWNGWRFAGEPAGNGAHSMRTITV